MRKKKIKLRYKKERVVFSDVLPYELPFIFTNRYFYRFLVKNEVYIGGDEKLHWKNGIHKGALAILALLSQYSGKQLKEKDEINLKSDKRLITIPFNYSIKHKETSNRRLSIVHPLNQIQMVDFYNCYKNTILYMCGKSHFSIRYPNKVACYFYYKDRLHSTLLGKKSDKLEIYFSEYENMKTFFSYKQYPNIYKFYEDYRYQRAEKKYLHLLKFDIQGCFDNIYTHSIAWAVNGGVNIYKDSFEGEDDSFASEWDKIMQYLNYNETNGIVIGPEFSRIFAEVIMQHIDLRAESELLNAGFKNKVDYECYRYVDDFFLFYNDIALKEKVLRVFDELLREFKMTISHEKTVQIERPFITDITRAKNLIDVLIRDTFFLSDSVVLEEDEDRDEHDEEREELPIDETRVIKALAQELHFHLKATNFNKKYKDILSTTNVVPKDVANYTLAIANIHLSRLLKKYDKVFKTLKKALDNVELAKYHDDCNKIIEQLESRLTNYLLELVESVFFIFSENERINTTLKLSQVLNEIIIYLDNDYNLSKTKKIKRFTNNIRTVVFKKIRDEICLVMQRSPMNQDTQLETLYLLPVFRQMKAKYRLTSVEIEKYLGVEWNADGSVKSFPQLNALAIDIILYYMGSSSEYDKLRKALKDEIMKMFEKMPPKRRHRSAEMAILALDLVACPFLGMNQKSYKQKILQSMGLSRTDANNIAEYMKTQKYMFTRWTGVNVTKELNAKISQEVYS